MCEIIVITSGKGGVGKTTVTANIGLGLANLNKKVVVVDTDIGLRNLDVVLGLENRIVYNLIDVIEGSCRMKQALIIDKHCENLYLLPSAQTRDNAIAGENRAVGVTTPEVSAIRDADRIIGLLQANQKPKIELIINRLRMDMIQKGEMMSVEDVSEILAVDLLGAVPDDEAVVIATNQGEPLCGKQSLAGQAFWNICRRICGEAVPLLDFEVKKGLWKRFSELFRR